MKYQIKIYHKTKDFKKEPEVVTGSGKGNHEKQKRTQLLDFKGFVCNTEKICKKDSAVFRYKCLKCL